MNRLCLAIPLYTHVSAAWFVNFLAMDRAAVVDFLAVRKIYLASAMTKLVEGALASGVDWDRLVIFEADMLPGADAFNRIAAYPDTLDVVGCAYFAHPPPHHPIIWTQVDANAFTPLASNQVDDMMAKPGVYPVDGVGFGFTSIHRRVLEGWDHSTPMFGGELELGHDLWFCRAARAQGFGVHVDTGIHCGHLTEVPITYEDTKQ